MARRGFNMTDLHSGDIWDLAGGKRVEILDRPFLWGGIRWVAVYDHDFSEDDPRLFKVTRFEWATKVP
jgi:hypothetical protein